MIKMEKFLISRRPYAVNLKTFRTTPNKWPSKSWSCHIEGVWFRRRSGVTVACIGDIWDMQSKEPKSALEMLERHQDGRYGGNTEGRWDGDGYWGNVSLTEQQRHLAILQPMLENYPEVPPGYDGWWRFETTNELYAQRVGS